jgi:hypothetical protein
VALRAHLLPLRNRADDGGAWVGNASVLCYFHS